MLARERKDVPKKRDSVGCVREEVRVPGKWRKR